MPQQNRILAEIAHTRERFANAVVLGDIRADRFPAIGKALSLTPEQYGELKDEIATQILCAVSGCPHQLPYNEADTILDILGYSVNHFNRQSVAVKATIIREYGGKTMPLLHGELCQYGHPEDDDYDENDYEDEFTYDEEYYDEDDYKDDWEDDDYEDWRDEDD